MEAREISRTDKIRLLNDHLRRTFTGGSIMLTAAVAALDQKKKARLLTTVRIFDSFTPDNDPHGEHDMAMFDFERERYFFKIDYYSPDMQYGSDDPSNPVVTRRVITIGHASDY
jgi:hypothetical protein